MLNGIGSLYYSYLKYLFNVYFRVSLVNVYNICGGLPQHQNTLQCSSLDQTFGLAFTSTGTVLQNKSISHVDITP